MTDTDSSIQDETREVTQARKFRLARDRQIALLYGFGSNGFPYNIEANACIDAIIEIADEYTAEITEMGKKLIDYGPENWFLMNLGAPTAASCSDIRIWHHKDNPLLVSWDRGKTYMDLSDMPHPNQQQPFYSTAKAETPDDHVNGSVLTTPQPGYEPPEIKDAGPANTGSPTLRENVESYVFSVMEAMDITDPEKLRKISEAMERLISSVGGDQQVINQFFGGGMESGPREDNRDPEDHDGRKTDGGPVDVNEGDLNYVPEDLQLKARRVVCARVIKSGQVDNVPFGLKDVYVVWFSKTLQNWKALLSTNLPDGRYYELTFDGQRNMAYLDTYTKVVNEPIDGTELY